jgi:hypothetical protein
MKFLTTLTLLSFLAFACNKKASVPANDGKHFGEKITKTGAISYDDLLIKLKTTTGMEGKVKGKVSSVCQVKGCWMTIVSDKPGQPSMMVKFKDYGFFMPKDLSGQIVIMKGKAYTETTPVEELRHYAEDAGKSKEEIAAIVSPKTELKFLASGVVID